MLIRFALTDQCYSCPEPIIRRVLKIWKERGVLYYSPDFVKPLPARLRKLWRQGRLHANWIEISDTSGLTEEGLLEIGVEQLGSMVELLGLKHAGSLDGDSGHTEEVGIGTSGLERVLVENIDQARCLQRAEELAHAPIQKGTIVDDLWARRFGPVVAHTRRATIVDPYAVAWLGKRGTDSGLFQFLARCGREAAPKHVKVISRNEQGGPSHDEIKRLLSQTGGPNTEVYLVDKARWGRDLPIDRWIQFDRFVFEIGHGLEVLEGREVRRTTSFTFKRISPVLEEEAMSLQSRARTPLSISSG